MQAALTVAKMLPIQALHCYLVGWLAGAGRNNHPLGGLAPDAAQMSDCCPVHMHDVMREHRLNVHISLSRNIRMVSVEGRRGIYNTIMAGMR
jgi:hypothetical protein